MAVHKRDGVPYDYHRLLYWDDIPEPRPESYGEDYSLDHGLPEADREAFYRNMRATAESGWDFSSRWMRDPRDLRTLETTALVPVDLNCVLYEAERTIAMRRRARGMGGEAVVAQRFERAAAERKRTLLAVAYDPSQGSSSTCDGRPARRSPIAPPLRPRRRFTSASRRAGRGTRLRRGSSATS